MELSTHLRIIIICTACISWKILKFLFGIVYYVLESIGDCRCRREQEMKWDTLEEEQCSVARTVAVIGDRWTLLILRECFLRVRRFQAFQSALGITRPLLAGRPEKLVAHG